MCAPSACPLPRCRGPAPAGRRAGRHRPGVGSAALGSRGLERPGAAGDHPGTQRAIRERQTKRRVEMTHDITIGLGNETDMFLSEYSDPGVIRVVAIHGGGNVAVEMVRADARNIMCLLACAIDIRVWGKER